MLALQVQIIGYRIDFIGRWRPGKQFELQLVDDFGGDFVLDREDVFECAVSGFRPEVSVGPCIDELCRNTNLVAGFAYRPLENM